MLLNCGKLCLQDGDALRCIIDALTTSRKLHSWHGHLRQRAA